MFGGGSAQSQSQSQIQCLQSLDIPIVMSSHCHCLCGRSHDATRRQEWSSSTGANACGTLLMNVTAMLRCFLRAVSHATQKLCLYSDKPTFMLASSAFLKSERESLQQHHGCHLSNHILIICAFTLGLQWRVQALLQCPSLHLQYLTLAFLLPASVLKQLLPCNTRSLKQRIISGLYPLLPIHFNC